MWNLSLVGVILAQQPVRRSALHRGLVLCLLLVCACGQKSEPISVQPNAVVLAFGDSLTAGVGAAKGESYPEQLARIVGIAVVNAGVSGETTEEGLERLPKVLADVDPDIVLLCLGGNDMLRKKSLVKMQQNLSEMIALIQGANAQPVLLGVPEPTLFGLDDHPVYAEIAKSHGITLIPGLFSDVLADRKLKSDRIHPNARGYRQVAEKIAGRFRLE